MIPFKEVHKSHHHHIHNEEFPTTRRDACSSPTMPVSQSESLLEQEALENSFREEWPLQPFCR